MDLFALGEHQRTIWAVLGEPCVCVCVCVCVGGVGEQPPVPIPMSYVTVFKLYLGGELFLCLLLYTSMLIKHIATFNIPVYCAVLSSI